MLIAAVSCISVNFNLKEAKAEDTNKKIVIGFDMVINKADNLNKYDNKDEDYILKNSKEQGLQVICPTWFYLDGEVEKPENINIYEKGDKEYANVAHKNGYKVWAVLGDCNREIGKTKDSVKRANKIFNDAAIQSKIIDQTVKYVKEYNVDGINIDFEALGKENKDGFTNFVKKLYPKLKEIGCTLSVDVNAIAVNSIYSETYDRPELAKNCDYLVFMAYDEHWGGSITPGSVASYDWVQKGVNDILKQGVPKEKLILGVPFYTIDYAFVKIKPEVDSVIVTSNTYLYKNKCEDGEKVKECIYGENFKLLDKDDKWYEVEYNNNKYYLLKSATQFAPKNEIKLFNVGYDSRGMNEVDKLYNDLKKDSRTNTFYDEYVKQNVIEYYKKDKSGRVDLQHQIWKEDLNSMEWRIDVVNKYDLAGAGAWKLYNEDPKVWELFKANLGKFKGK